jgi:glycosyltransferase A (GT-A) superfamily protein (DUF2064 family)
MTTLLVLAKAPRAGCAKTRLAPTFGPDGAARLAAAALQDTLDAVAAAPARRRVLVLEGDLEAAAPVDVPATVDVVPQVPGDHARRIAAALAGCRGPALLIGMDTPQVTPALLHLSPGATGPLGADAWLGRAEDGGWWGLGLRRPDLHARAALAGVPMSTPRTGAAQHDRLRRLGLTVTLLPVLRDVDTPHDAAAVAAAAPGTRFARLHRELAGQGCTDA